ncbi:uncharacterized protein SCHCODRAFT_02474427, partial [Schizophyllum commune H4-8]|uniref:uncharacterized protein n=1 Tax=Schizophyllum commune (strain H4-8 / FGSC 9210) TaxID=578458 RepID=UPI002160DE77
VIVGLDDSELQTWRDAYQTDNHFRKVLDTLNKEENWSSPVYPQYHYSEQGLVYFEDSNGNNRLCVPASLRSRVMSDVHDTISEAAHGG